MQITVTRKERKAPTLGLSTPRGATHLDVASVTITSGKIKIEVGFSRYSTESDWYIDYQFTNSLPDFCHGEGSRSCLKKIAQGALREAIEAANLVDLTDLERQEIEESEMGLPWNPMA